MGSKRINAACVSCGKSNISKNEIGISIKLLGEKIENYYCLDCLADYLEVTVDELNEKIDEFKDEGCKLFD